MRHAQTNGNKYKLEYGLIDFPINYRGIEQAKLKRKEILEISPDLIICSPMLRTRETMSIVKTKAPVIFDKRIIEIDEGVITGLPLNLLDKDYYNILKKNNYKFSESYRNVFNRVYSFLDEINIKYKNKRILLITHNGIIRVINTYFNGIPSDGNIKKLGIKNAEIIRFI